MSIPTQSYARVNNTEGRPCIVTLKLRKGDVSYDINVARFLSTYFTTGATTAQIKDKLKELFYLDEVEVINKLGVAVGFVGMVTIGSKNSSYHHLGRRYGGEGQNGVIYLNDSGLNSKAHSLATGLVEGDPKRVSLFFFFNLLRFE